MVGGQKYYDPPSANSHHIHTESPGTGEQSHQSTTMRWKGEGKGDCCPPSEDDIGSVASSVEVGDEGRGWEGGGVCVGGVCV